MDTPGAAEQLPLDIAIYPGRMLLLLYMQYSRAATHHIFGWALFHLELSLPPSPFVTEKRNKQKRHKRDSKLYTHPPERQFPASGESRRWWVVEMGRSSGRASSSRRACVSGKLIRQFPSINSAYWIKKSPTTRIKKKKKMKNATASI